MAWSNRDVAALLASRCRSARAASTHSHPRCCTGNNRSQAMTLIRIDFGPRTLTRVIARTSLATWLLVAAGLLFCASMATHAWTLLQQYRARELELHRIDTQLADRR